MTSDTITATTNMPLVIPTKTQQITARLILRNDLGQIIQQWLIRQNKCTLGSSAGCNLRCELPGIAPYHALLVLGARQIFVRALAPKLTRDGVRVNEILLTDENNSFEIAGHRFELNRGTPETLAESKRSPERLKFTLARPFEINNRNNSPKPELSPPSISTAKRPDIDDRRVAQLLQSAMEPLECRLENILEPLAELQAESRRQRELSQQLIAERSEFAETWLQRESQMESFQAKLPVQFNELSTRQSAAMDIIGERISDVTSQLSALEHIIATDREESTTRAEVSKLNEESEIQATAIAQLQSGIVSVSSAIQDLESRQQSARQEDSTWKKTVQNQLSALRDSVESIATSVEENATQTATTEQETAWRAEIQGQFGLLRDFAQKALERAEAAQRAAEKVGSTVNEYIETSRRDTLAEENDAAWRSDVQSQFSQLRETLETISTQTQQRLPQPSVDVPATSQAVQETTTPTSLSTDATNQSYATHGFLTEPRNESTADDTDVAPDYLAFFNQHFTSNDDSDQSDNSQIGPPTGGQASDSRAEPQVGLPSDSVKDAEICAALPTPRDVWQLHEEENPDSFDDNEISEVETLDPSSITYDAQSEVTVADDPLELDESAIEEAIIETDDDGLQNSPAEEFESEPTSFGPRFVATAREEGPEDIPEIVDTSFHTPAPAIASGLPANYFDETEESESDSIEPHQLPSWWKEESNESTGSHNFGSEDVVDSNTDSQENDFAFEYQHETPPNLTVKETYPAKRETLHASEIDYVEAPARAVEEPAQVDSGEDELFGMSNRDEQASSEEQYSMFQADVPETAYEDVEDELYSNQTDSELTAQPTSTPPHQLSAEEEEEETSVEDYMRNLLARMRGAPEEQVKTPAAHSKSASTPPAPKPSSSLKESVPQRETQPTIMPAAGEFGATTAKPFNPEEFIPRVTTPEQIRNLAAMRDLANSSARTAIHKSTKQRSIASVVIALCISCVGLTVGAVLIVINGFSMNIALIATFAAFLVAIIWGYDATVSLKPLLRAGIVLDTAPSNAESSEDE